MRKVDTMRKAGTGIVKVVGKIDGYIKGDTEPEKRKSLALK